MRTGSHSKDMSFSECGSKQYNHSNDGIKGHNCLNSCEAERVEYVNEKDTKQDYETVLFLSEKILEYDSTAVLLLRE